MVAPDAVAKTASTKETLLAGKVDLICKQLHTDFQTTATKVGRLDVRQSERDTGYCG